MARLSVRAEQKLLTRDRLLDAAVEVFAEKSSLEATMDDIARAAAVSRVTVYAHFSGKTEIVLGLADRLYALGDEVYADLAGRSVWTRAAVRDWLDVVEARWREQAASIRVLTMAGPPASTEGTIAARERYVDLLVGDPDRWRAVTPAQARQRALLIALLIESFFAAWIATGWPSDTDDPLDLLADTLCHLLAPALSDRS
ncbi:TetR/AcrR family transcriptional regulator [Nocardia pseudobrasiliensis]|uniref:TetR family transcriptional regulator n=1 Tax=Nocardia pseudobrasiliensis TaxID=45979 RepID=A0A370I362_9NOCA|nr:TetR/AcrR family transcriptional regulator [Nocardia pseudobrasiliensis]RDI65182.1 TetR family transcriptional regulator [Nocardia pseudobrasiliensis]